MLGVVVPEKRWMIVVGLSRCGRWRWQPARYLVQEAPSPHQGTDHAQRPQSGLKPAAQIARTALQQLLCSGPVAQGIPQPLASPVQVVPQQRAVVVGGAGEEGDVVLTLWLDPGCDLPVGGQRPDGVSGSHSDAGWRTAEPHRLIEMAESDLELTIVPAHAHHASGLVGGKQHRELQTL